MDGNLRKSSEMENLKIHGKWKIKKKTVNVKFKKSTEKGNLEN